MTIDPAVRKLRQPRTWTLAAVLGGCLATAAGPTGIRAETLAQADGVSSPAAVGLEAGDERPVLFTADEITYESQRRITIARGNVEIARGDRVLLADEVTYDETRDLVTAVGNVSLLEPTGETVFGSAIEVTGDLKNAVIEDIRAVLADGSRLAAAGGRRTEGRITEMNKGVYTPCDLCPSDPEAPPLWQIKGVRVVHDQTEKIIEFTDAWLEIEGVPVFYVPYIYQPDPTVKRKTGFLIPLFGISSDLGFVYQQPFFWAITPDQDVTLTPWITSSEGPVLEAQYRRALTHGEIEFNGSITRDSRQRTRGHVESQNRYDISRAWRAGLDVNRASDSTYLRRYEFDTVRTLTSRAYAEAFDGRNYFLGRGLAFQGNAEDDRQDEIPIVLPMMDYFYESGVDPLGGRTNVRLDALSLTRVEGTDTRRLSARAGWDLPMVGPLGDVYTVSASLWGDGYQVDDFRTEDRQNEFSGLTGRIFPQAGLNWSFPFVRDDPDFPQYVEPVVEVIAAPRFGNPGRIPNEDSSEFELQDTNLFGADRFPGLDRVEEGPRVNYGLSWGGFGPAGSQAAVSIGQTYRFFQDEDVFARGTGLDDNFSDIVGVIDLAPHPVFNVLYRTRIDKDDFDARRHELGARVGVDALRLEATYLSLDEAPERTFVDSLDGSRNNNNNNDDDDDDDDDEFGNREEIEFALSSQLTRYWRTRLFGIRDLTGGGSQRSIGIRFTYEDECFVFGVEFERRDLEDRDIEPSNAVFLRLGFKTLGDLGAGFTRGG
jgi:LPS-assembly protein